MSQQQHPPQPKVLGEGTTRKVGNSISLSTVKYGFVDVPYSAIRLNYERKHFDPESGETIYFSASFDGEHYVATSVIRPTDLVTYHGALTLLDTGGKFGHVTITGRNLKIFVPFSTKFAGGCWYGTGAEVGKIYTLNVFRQEESHGCKFVAWSICEGRGLNNLPPQHMDTPQVTTMKKLGQPNAVQRQSDHLSVDFITGHIGVIFEVSEQLVVTVTSPTCQITYFPGNLFEDWMKPGRFVKFDGRRISDNKIAKLLGSNPVDIGAVFPYFNISPLAMTIPAVLNKVHIGKSAWAWNDHIGRVFVPWNVMDKNMTASRPGAFTAVLLEIAYNGKHDEIPWVASAASLCNDDDSSMVLTDYAQLLKTEDGWKMQSSVDGPENPSLFLIKYDENRKTTAFAKIIDMNCAEIPANGTLLRVTFYSQERHGRHALRAVLVTPLDKDDNPSRTHPVHIGGRLLHYPTLFEEPTPAKERVAAASVPQKPPPPPKSCWNLSKLGAPNNAAASTYRTSHDFPAVNEKKGESSSGIPPVVPHDNIPSFSAQQELSRSVSVWSGTPVEAKPEPIPFYNAATGNYHYGSTQSSSYFPTSGDQFVSHGFGLTQSSSSTAMMPISVSDLRSTQSESSSPGLKMDELGEMNTWSFTASGYSNSFQYGLPPGDLPIYQRLASETSSADAVPETPAAQPDLCTCPLSNAFLDLWKEPGFIAYLSTSDYSHFQRFQQIIGKSCHTSHNAF